VAEMDAGVEEVFGGDLHGMDLCIGRKHRSARGPPCDRRIRTWVVGWVGSLPKGKEGRAHGAEKPEASVFSLVFKFPRNGR
jgi:hypothetical protein